MKGEPLPDGKLPASAPGSSTWRRVLAALATLLALFVGGYWVYTRVVGGLLFRAQSASTLPSGLILVLAVLAGAASFFSPCSLAITPAFLAYFVEHEAEHVEARDGRHPLRAALLVAIGIVGVSAIAGVLVATIGAIVYNVLIYLIPLVGAAFVVLGAMLLLARGSALGGASRYLPGRRYYERALKGMGPTTGGQWLAFGAAYGAASHSCTLPVLVGVLMLPVAAGSYWLAAVAVLVYGISLAGLMLLMLKLGQTTLIAVRRRLGRSLEYVVGGLFVVTGGYLFYYFVVNYGFAFGP